MVVNLEQISKRQNRQVILQNIELAIPPNSICGLFGPNGAGKTSLLRVLTGIWRPSSGRLSLFDEPWHVTALQRIGIVWDRPVFHETWTGLTMLQVYSKLYHGTAQKGERLFPRLGLQGSEAIAIRHYSLGMRKRLAIGLALLKDPQLLILDEPSDGLDAPSTRVLWDTLRHFAQNGKSVIVTSHHLEEAIPVYSMAMVLVRGRSIGLWSKQEEADIDLSTWLSQRLEGHHDILQL